MKRERYSASDKGMSWSSPGILPSCWMILLNAIGSGGHMSKVLRFIIKGSHCSMRCLVGSGRTSGGFEVTQTILRILL